jgi:predicted NBD/HSP70 family sugar kinase
MNVVFDLGGTHLRCAIDSGRSLQRIERLRWNGGWPEILSAMRSYVHRARERFATLSSITIAFPGPIDASGKPLCAPTVARGEPPDVAASLAEFGVPVRLLNDVSSAAWYAGAVTGVDRFIVVTVSSGIGSKIYDRSRAHPVIDGAPYAGELGHVRVDFSAGAPLCDCGGYGHLGAIASARAIERRVRAAFDGSFSNEEAIVPLLRAGDRRLFAILRESTLPLAQTLAGVVQACGLQRVFVIGGFISAIGPPYARMLDELLCERIAPAAFGERSGALVEMLPNADEACLRGAALFASAQPQHTACAS